MVAGGRWWGHRPVGSVPAAPPRGAFARSSQKRSRADGSIDADDSDPDAHRIVVVPIVDENRADRTNNCGSARAHHSAASPAC